MPIIHIACPFDGRKLRKVDAYEVATTVTQRTCKGCRRRLAVTVQPVAAIIDNEHAYAPVVTVAEKRTAAGC